MTANTDQCVPATSPQRAVRSFSPACSLAALAAALRECAERLCVGPHNSLAVVVGADGGPRLLRRRAADVLEAAADLATWRVLWRAIIGEGLVVKPTTSARNRLCFQLPDGHGRLLVMCASLLSQVLSPNAHYPVVGSSLSSRNRLRLLRVLHEMTSSGELQDIPVEEDGISDASKEGKGDDVIGRMTRAALGSLQSYYCCTSNTRLTRQVLEGCIHFIMRTEVEGDVLTSLRQLLVRFLWSSESSDKRVTCRSIAARAQSVLTDSASYILPCLGAPILSSRTLPFGTFFLPIVSAALTPHQGTATPFFALECRDGEQPQWVMLLRIDAKGGLLDFEHSKQKNDAWSSSSSCSSNSSNNNSNGSGSDTGEDDEEGQRSVQRSWTAAEQDEAQCEAAQLLYEWAWAHGVTVILTPSHVPPVVKTYGCRYHVARKNTDGIEEGRSIFMVDEVDEAVFDGLLRRFQYCRHERQGDADKAFEMAVPACPAAAILRRGKLVLPDCAEDALLPVRRVAYGPPCALLLSSVSHRLAANDVSGMRAVLLELDRSVLPLGVADRTQGSEGLGAMLLASPTPCQLQAYTALLLKCLKSVLTAVSSSSFAGETGSECGLGFVRAGGALSIALSRQMRRSAEALKRQMRGMSGPNSATDRSHCNDSDARLPVAVAVLQMLSEALLEVPRRLAAHITAHHRPLRHAWLRLESDELRRGSSPVFGSISLLREPSLHVYLRENVNFYRRIFRPPLNDVRTHDEERRYFCCSDTESSESESDDEGTYRWEASREPPSFSFVEPVAATAGVLRGAITLLRLTLLSVPTADETVSL